MARYHSLGTKSYKLINGVYEEVGDDIYDGIGTVNAWINDDEADKTFEVGDTFGGFSRYIGKIAIPLVSGGSATMPLLQSIAQPNSVWIESSIFPLDPDLRFPDVLDINSLNVKPFSALIGPTPMNDNFKGVKGPETVFLDTGNDVFQGGGGADSVYGEAGRDRISGQRGKDYLDGGDGKDTLLGGTGDDTIYGGSGADRLKGDRGDDKLEGDAGRDKLWGGKGDDIFYDSAGNDVMWGGAGADTFTFAVSDYRPVHGTDKIRDFDEAKDQLYVFVENPEEVEVSHASGNTIIDYDAGRVVLVGVHVDADSDAFLFA